MGSVRFILWLALIGVSATGWGEPTTTLRRRAVPGQSASYSSAGLPRVLARERELSASEKAQIEAKIKEFFVKLTGINGQDFDVEFDTSWASRDASIMTSTSAEARERYVRFQHRNDFQADVEKPRPKIFLGRGFMELFLRPVSPTDDLLAGVLLHEFYHETSDSFWKEKAEEMKRSRAESSAVAVYLSHKFSQGNEFHSDVRALAHLLTEGYAPEPFLALLEHLHQMQGDKEAEIGTESDWFKRTHPQSRDRLSFLRAALREFMKDEKVFKYQPGRRPTKDETVNALFDLFKKYDAKFEQFYNSKEYERLYWGDFQLAMDANRESLYRTYEGYWANKFIIALHRDAFKYDYNRDSYERVHEVSLADAFKVELRTPPAPARPDMIASYDQRLAGARARLPAQLLSHMGQHYRDWLRQQGEPKEEKYYSFLEDLSARASQHGGAIDILSEYEKLPGHLRDFRDNLQIANDAMADKAIEIILKAAEKPEFSKSFISVPMYSPLNARVRDQLLARLPSISPAAQSRIAEAWIEVLSTRLQNWPGDSVRLLGELIKKYPKEALLKADAIAPLATGKSNSYYVRERDRGVIKAWMQRAMDSADLAHFTDEQLFESMPYWTKEIGLSIEKRLPEIARRMRDKLGAPSAESLSSWTEVYSKTPILRPYLAKELDQHLAQLIPLAFHPELSLQAAWERAVKEGDERSFEDFSKATMAKKQYDRDKILMISKIKSTAHRLRSAAKDLPDLPLSRAALDKELKPLEDQYIKNFLALPHDEMIAVAVDSFFRAADAGSNPSRSGQLARWQKRGISELVGDLAGWESYTEANERGLSYGRYDGMRDPQDDLSHFRPTLISMLIGREVRPELRDGLYPHREEILYRLFTGRWGMEHRFRNKASVGIDAFFRKYFGEPKVLDGVIRRAIQDKNKNFNADLFKRWFNREVQWADVAATNYTPKEKLALVTDFSVLIPQASLDRLVQEVIQDENQAQQASVNAVHERLRSLQGNAALPTYDELVNELKALKAPDVVVHLYTKKILDSYFAQAKRRLSRKEYGDRVEEAILKTPKMIKKRRDEEAAPWEVSLRDYRFTLRDELDSPELVEQAVKAFVDRKTGIEEYDTYERRNKIVGEDHAYADYPTAARIANRILESKLPFNDKLRLYDAIESELSLKEANRFWDELVVRELKNRAYSEEEAAALINRIYPHSRDSVVRRTNDVANLYLLDRAQIDSLEERLFPNREKAGAYSELLGLQHRIKSILSQNPGPEALLSLVRWLQGKTDEVPPIAQGFLPSLDYSTFGAEDRSQQADASRKRSRETRAYRELRERFQSAPIAARAALLVELVDPNQTNSLTAPGNAEGTRLLYNMLTDGLEAEYAPLARLILETYVESRDEHLKDGYQFLAELLAAGTGKSENKGAAELARDLLASRGSLWHKFGQMLGADPTLIPDDEVRKMFLTLNERSAIPARKDMYKLIEEALASEGFKLKKIHQVLAAGSVNATAIVELQDGRFFVARVLKHDAGNAAKYERDILLTMAKRLKEKAKRLDPKTAERVRMIANALEEYGTALTEKLEHESNLSHDRRIFRDLFNGGKDGSYSATYADLGARVELVGEADSGIVFQSEPDGPGAKGSRLILYEIVGDEKETLEKDHPELYRRFQRAAWRAELEALFKFGKFDPDGHLGNWRVIRDPADPTKLILRRIDYSQAETLSAVELEALRKSLGFLLQNEFPMLVRTSQISEDQFLKAFHRLVGAIDGTELPSDFDATVRATLRDLLRERGGKGRNPARLLSELKSRVNDRLPDAHRIRFKREIQMAIKSLFITQQLIDARNPEEAHFMAKEFLRVALEKNTAERAWIGANVWLREKWDQFFKPKPKPVIPKAETVQERFLYAQEFLKKPLEVSELTARRLEELYNAHSTLREKILEKAKEVLFAPAAEGSEKSRRVDYEALFHFLLHHLPDPKALFQEALRNQMSAYDDNTVLSNIAYETIRDERPEYFPLLVEELRSGNYVIEQSISRRTSRELRSYLEAEFGRNLTGISLNFLKTMNLINSPAIAAKVRDRLRHNPSNADLSAYFGPYVNSEILHPDLMESILAHVRELIEKSLEMPMPKQLEELQAYRTPVDLTLMRQAIYHSKGEAESEQLVNLYLQVLEDWKKAAEQITDEAARKTTLSFIENQEAHFTQFIREQPLDPVALRPLLGDPKHALTALNSLFSQWRRSNGAEKERWAAEIQASRLALPSQAMKDVADEFSKVFIETSSVGSRYSLGDGHLLERTPEGFLWKKKDVTLGKYAAEAPLIWDFFLKRGAFAKNANAVEVFEKMKTLRGFLELVAKYPSQNVMHLYTGIPTTADWRELQRYVERGKDPIKKAADTVAQSFYKHGKYHMADSAIAGSFAQHHSRETNHPEGVRVDPNFSPVWAATVSARAARVGAGGPLSLSDALGLIPGMNHSQDNYYLPDLAEASFENPQDFELWALATTKALGSRSNTSAASPTERNRLSRIINQRLSCEDGLGDFAAVD